MDDKVCVITGGGGSIGRAAAARLVGQGARVMLVDLSEDKLKGAVAELGKDRTAMTTADVSSARALRAAMDATVARFGKIDVIVACAGTIGVVKPIVDYPEDVFDSVLAVHVRGAFLACKYGLPNMNDGGSIILVSSVAGVTGDPGVSAYVTAKHALVGLMRSAAKEAAPRRIRVNTLHPGPVANDFQAAVEMGLSEVLGRDAAAFFDESIPLGRHGRPDEIGDAVLFLASDQSSFITGSLLMVDGGMSI
jgi:NAD(P)-dependent dehydrogenase (short-subunit alcohol dehydrogenase family)